MAKALLQDQPLAVKVAVFVTFFNAWVLFEELVIDRHGLWRYLPFYRVGVLCIWDVLALAVIGLGVFLRWTRAEGSEDRRPWCRIRWCRVC
jgi:hypothetical protein